MLASANRCIGRSDVAERRGRSCCALRGRSACSDRAKRARPGNQQIRPGRARQGGLRSRLPEIGQKADPARIATGELQGRPHSHRGRRVFASWSVGCADHEVHLITLQHEFVGEHDGDPFGAAETEGGITRAIGPVVIASLRPTPRAANWAGAWAVTAPGGGPREADCQVSWPTRSSTTRTMVTLVYERIVCRSKESVTGWSDGS